MKIINKPTGEIITEIITNHSMTLEEAIECVGSFVPQENPWDANVEINGTEYWSEELDIIA